MKFSTLVSTAALAAEVAYAARGTAARRTRAAAKRDAKRSSHPKIESKTETSSRNATKEVDYSENWAGAVYLGSGITEVTGSITVPTPESTGVGESCASAWVGIDGDTCSTAILQTGVDFCVEGGEVSYDAWYEWYPDYAYDFELDVSAGDELTFTVTASSSSSGKAVIENSSTGKTATYSWSNAEGDLCEENAEWIVEDFEEGGSLVSFADFGSVEFTGATATTSSGTVEAGDYSELLDIEQTTVLTDCSASGSTVTCTYV